ncbi:MAG: hypothetical protein AAF907_10875, partial [Planctomycetota bacterium]
MNLPRITARLAALAAAAVVAPAAFSQGIVAPQGAPTPRLGVLCQNGRCLPRPIYRPNPIVHRDGFVDTEYDPFTNITDVNRQTLSTRASAYDPNRGVVDPGSLRQIDRWIRVNGQWVREHGTTWTSYGVPHGHLTRDRSTFRPYAGAYPTPHPLPYPTPFPGQGGVRENDRDTVLFSTGRPQPLPG